MKVIAFDGEVGLHSQLDRDDWSQYRRLINALADELAKQESGHHHRRYPRLTG
jgi:hypothetical protein